MTVEEARAAAWAAVRGFGSLAVPFDKAKDRVNGTLDALIRAAKVEALSEAAARAHQGVCPSGWASDDDVADWLRARAEEASR